MDANFVDLDILLTRIRDPRSKKYFLEAVKSYKAGASRSAISAAWIAVVYDLIAKYRELGSLGDAAAADFIAKWDDATTKRDIKKLLDLEGAIVSEAATKTQVISRVAETHLLRLREDRHFCAHPAFSTEADLFEPPPELVRLHLVNAIELVLSQEPLQGKAILDQYNTDVQSPGFPSSLDKIRDYVEERYLSRIRASNVKNFGIVLAKALLKGVPPEWDSHRLKVGLSLIAVRERAPESWPEISTNIARHIDTVEPAHRLRAIAFLTEFPDFWALLQEATKTVLHETVANIEPADLTDFQLLSAVRLPDFQEPVLEIIAQLSEEQLGSALALKPLIELWPSALQIYAESDSFRGSESNFRDLIMPFSGGLQSEHLGDLLTAVAGNGQNWDASETPELLARILKNSAHADLPIHAAREEFFRAFGKRHGVLARFDESIELLKEDGWTPPQLEKDED